MISTLRIASRKSALARVQSYEVASRLQKIYPDLKIEFIFQESLGDKNLDSPLWQLPEKGVFTKDLQHDLIEERCDLVVHSWKDLPIEMPKETEIIATLERADIRDVLLLKKTIDFKKTKEKLHLLSSSPRRIYNLSKLLPEILPFKIEEIFFESVRGNVPTRVRKLLNHPTADALILAKAALDRLLAAAPIPDPDVEAFQLQLRQDLLKLRWMVLPLSQNPTAPAQGALAIEIKSDRQDLKTLLSPIHSADVFENVKNEREILKKYGGGCHQKIGATVLSAQNTTVLFLKGETPELDKSKPHELSFQGLLSNYKQVISIEDNKNQKKFWPQPGEKTKVFERTEAQWPSGFKPTHDAVFSVSRAHALPVSFEADHNTILWVAGVTSWKHLAQRGLWVNGSHDSLGEEDLQKTLIYLAPQKTHFKLTHDRAPGNNVATYSLKTRPDSQKSKVPVGVEECYWMSASLFDEMMAREPDLLKRIKKHACGMGQTYLLIKERIESAGASIELYTGPEEWWKVKGFRLEES